MQKKTLINVSLFVLCNFIGCFVGSLTFYLVKWMNPSGQINDLALIGDVGFILMTWAVCALFSFSIFFLHGRWRLFFLMAPIVMPMIHAIILMQGH